MPIRIVIADDHAVVRAGIASVIQSSAKQMKIIGEAVNGKEFIEIARNTPADVFVVDIEMPVLDGINAIEHLRKIQPQAKVVILSMYTDRIIVERAFKSGARGYVVKEGVVDEIVRAIEEVHRGRYYISPRISGYLIENLVSKKASETETSADSMLTNREREILKLLCEGFSEKETARALDISPHTVHVHKNNLMKKLDIHNRAGLIRYALKYRIIH